MIESTDIELNRVKAVHEQLQKQMLDDPHVTLTPEWKRAREVNDDEFYEVMRRRVDALIAEVEATATDQA